MRELGGSTCSSHAGEQHYEKIEQIRKTSQAHLPANIFSMFYLTQPRCPPKEGRGDTTARRKDDRLARPARLQATKGASTLSPEPRVNLARRYSRKRSPGPLEPVNPFGGRRRIVPDLARRRHEARRPAKSRALLFSSPARTPLLRARIIPRRRYDCKLRIGVTPSARYEAAR